ncbi:MAG: hypothetical protein M3O61_20510, partial [Gemmatimonadota bacterium]|nr:hypothetical protein [Gemmatimonadota bacterium]
MGQIMLDPAAGPATVTIDFGHAELGFYTIVLWDRSLTTKAFVGEGGSGDRRSDTYTLPGSPRDLAGCWLDCVATIVAPAVAPGQQYS